jgi:hypothetical protein
MYTISFFGALQLLKKYKNTKEEEEEEQMTRYLEIIF